MRLILIAFILMIISLSVGRAEELNVDSLNNILIERIKTGEYDSESNMMYTIISDYLRRTDPLEAISYHYKMITISEQYNNNQFSSANFVSIGTIYRDQGLNGRAMDNFYQAMQYIDESHHGNYCWLYIFIGNVYYSEQLFDDAMSFYKLANVGFDSLGYDSKKITRMEDKDIYWSNEGKAVACNNIALCFRSMNQYDSAMYYFRKGLEYRSVQSNVFGIGHSIKYIGHLYALEEKYDSAMVMFNRALKYIDSAYYVYKGSKVEVKTNYSGVLYQIGIVYENLGQINKAEDYILQSLDTILLTQDKVSIAIRYMNLSEFYERHNETEKSIDYAQKALDISKNHELYALSLAATNYLYKLYLNAKQIDKAIEYADLHSSLKDSVYNKFNEFSIREVSTRIDNEKKLIDLERDKILNENNIKQQRNIIILLSIFVVVVLAGTIVLRNKLRIIRKLNKTLEEKNELLVETNNKLTESENNLKEINATKDKFFSIIAHDLKNPFGSFKNVLEMVSKDYDNFSDEEKRDFLAELSKSSLYLYNLLENLLTWSRSQRGKIEFHPQINSFKSIVDNNISFLEMNASKKDIKLISEVNDDLYATFDANMILTVLRNLISNAIKFTPHEGTITIGAEIKDDKLHAYVKDTGVGISEDAIEKLFRIDVNYRELGTDQEKGTGLGLILCKEFIETHDGRIWVESQIGVGSTFYFEIPYYNEEE